MNKIFWWIQNFELEMGRMITRPWFRCGSRPPDFLEKSPRPSPTLIMRVWRHRVCVCRTRRYFNWWLVWFSIFFLSRKSDAVGVDAGNFSICSKVPWCVGRWVPPVGLDWLIIEMMRRRRRSKCRWAPIRKLLPFHPPVFARSPDEGDAVMLFIAAGLHLPVN